jgi:hypothetical protein
LFIDAQMYTHTHTHGVSESAPTRNRIMNVEVSVLHFYANMAAEYILLVVQEPNQHGGPPGEGQSITPWQSERETGGGSFLFHLSFSLCVYGMCLLCTRHHNRRGYLQPSSGLRNNFISFLFFQNRLKNKRPLPWSETRNTTLQTDINISKNSWAAGTC